MEQLASYIVKNHKWYDSYTQKNRFNGQFTRVTRYSYSDIANLGSISILVLAMAFFTSWMSEPLDYNLYIVWPRYHWFAIIVVCIWIFSAISSLKSYKHYKILIEEWIQLYPDTEQWNTMSKELVKKLR